MCAGCSRDKQRKVQMLDMEMLTCSVNNEILFPYWNTEQNLLALKLSKKKSCLPSFAKKACDDHIFGAAQYLANTSDILIHNGPASNHLDKPMTMIES
jgi:hypothetical protein